MKNISVQKFKGKLGIAVSGGIDSMTMLYCYIKAGQKDFIVINIEHGIRGETSLRDTDFVRKFCEENNCEFQTFSVNVNESKGQGESIETCARRLRYEVFDRLIKTHVVDAIALAHHADDNAETILMHLFRGSGLRGLIGITSSENYIRPLLKYSRDEITKFAVKNNIEHIEDETNSDTSYTRNYVRYTLMPLIKERYPAFLNSLTKISTSAKEADEYLVKEAIQPTRTNHGYVIYNVFGQPEVLQKYSIMLAIKKMGHQQDFETRHIESILSLAKKPSNTSIDIPFGLVVTKHWKDLIFTKQGTEFFKECPFDLNMVYTFKGVSYSFVEANNIEMGSSLDFDKIPEDAVIRERLPGDTFKRVNGRTKSLSNFLTDLKLSKPIKDELLVLASGKKIYAILGVDTADDAKITDDTNKIIHIVKKRVGGKNE
ncbi:MAG: tRNA lysidine(34) synthetase TilS [Clostridia bacterium]|nr:tRNA lysidine(34) synthetase TilS [Clostridia bacterium]